MEIVWLTGRNLANDLASSTETNLVKELRLFGHDVTLVSPGKDKTNKFNNDLIINKISFPGMNTLSGVRNIRKHIVNNLIHYSENTVFLVDWRYVQPLESTLKKYINKWCIIDRGPPTYGGIFNKIQKWYWRRGWEIAEESSIGGFVVSEAHKKFVIKMNNVSLKIKAIPAGSIANIHNNGKKNPNNMLKLAYLGRMDVRRDVESIFTLSTKLSKAGIKHEINIYGGDSADKSFLNLASKNNRVTIHKRIDNSEIFKQLSYHHIGIMPMPDIPVWRISSPLKLAEYISSGLAIIGPKHPGNEFWGEGEWSLLSDDKEWTDGAVEKIKKYMESDWAEISQLAISSSTNMRWSEISKIIIISLEKWTIEP